MMSKPNTLLAKLSYALKTMLPVLVLFAILPAAYAQSPLVVEFHPTGTNKFLQNSESHDLGSVPEDGSSVPFTFSIMNVSTKSIMISNLQTGTINGPIVVQFQDMLDKVQLEPGKRLTFSGAIQADELVQKGEVTLPAPFSAQFKFENEATKTFEFFAIGKVARATNWTIEIISQDPLLQNPFVIELLGGTGTTHHIFDAVITNLSSEVLIIPEFDDFGAPGINIFVMQQPLGVTTTINPVFEDPPGDDPSAIYVSAGQSDRVPITLSVDEFFAQPGSYEASFEARDIDGVLRTATLEGEFGGAANIQVTGPTGLVAEGTNVVVEAEAGTQQQIQFTIDNIGSSDLNDLQVLLNGDWPFHNYV